MFEVRLLVQSWELRRHVLKMADSKAWRPPMMTFAVSRARMIVQDGLQEGLTSRSALSLRAVSLSSYLGACLPVLKPADWLHPRHRERHGLDASTPAIL